MKKIYKKFIEWLWFSDKYHVEAEEKIVMIKGWNSFLTDNKYGDRKCISICFDHWPNWKYIFKRIFSLGFYK